MTPDEKKAFVRRMKKGKKDAKNNSKKKVNAAIKKLGWKKLKQKKLSKAFIKKYKPTRKSSAENKVIRRLEKLKTAVVKKNGG